MFSVSAGVSAALGLAPRNVLPALKSKTRLLAVRKSTSKIEAAQPALASSQRLIFSPCGTGESPQAARKVSCAKRGWIFVSRFKASHADASLTVTYGSSGFSVLQCAELVTLTASRAPIKA